jgi:hypothetical protein
VCAGYFIALASLATACSSGGASIDVEHEIAADSLAAEFVSRIARSPGTTPSFDPQSVGETIAGAIDDLVARSDDDFRATGGISRRDLADAVGSLMGELATRLFELADDHGRRAVVDTTAYALELGSAIASKSASGPGENDRLGWLVPSVATLSDRVRRDVVDDLDARKFESATNRVIDAPGNFGPFQVLDAVERQLEKIVPADDAGHPRDDLRRVSSSSSTWPAFPTESDRDAPRPPPARLQTGALAVLTVKSPASASTVTVSPSATLPSRIARAMLSPSSRWMTRFNGRAPKTGS